MSFFFQGPGISAESQDLSIGNNAPLARHPDDQDLKIANSQFGNAGLLDQKMGVQGQVNDNLEARRPVVQSLQFEQQGEHNILEQNLRVGTNQAQNALGKNVGAQISLDGQQQGIQLDQNFGMQQMADNELEIVDNHRMGPLSFNQNKKSGGDIFTMQKESQDPASFGMENIRVEAGGLADGINNNEGDLPSRFDSETGEASKNISGIGLEEDMIMQWAEKEQKGGNKPEVNVEVQTEITAEETAAQFGNIGLEMEDRQIADVQVVKVKDDRGGGKAETMGDNWSDLQQDDGDEQRKRFAAENNAMNEWGNVGM